MSTFDFDQYMSLPRLSALRLSPDGNRLVVSVQQAAPDGKKMRSSIWAVDPNGERAPRRLTRSAPGESVGAFMPDGSLLFTSARPDPDRDPEGKDKEEETGRLWLLPAGGGEARLVCAPMGGVEDVRSAREAEVAVFSASVYPGAADLTADGERHQARKKAGVEALLFEGYPIRRWDHYLGPRERHLFAAQLSADDEPVLKPTDLTPDAGPALLETRYDVTPDGRTIVTGWIDYSDLTDPRERLLAIDRASGERRFLTELERFSYAEAAVSPDGRYVACARIASSEPAEPGDVTLWLVDLESGAGRDLTPDLDLWPHDPTWAADSSAIYFLADRRGAVAVHRVDLAGGGPTLLNGEDAWSDLAPLPVGGGLFALRSSYRSAPQIVRLVESAADAGGAVGGAAIVQPVPSFQALEKLELPATVERLTAGASDGAQISSWLVLPEGASKEAPAPLVVWVHGGPLGSWNAWHWRWNPHLLAARGYAVLLPDPALSTGYGLDFVARGWGRWGEEPYSDLIAAVDAALTRPDLDSGRTALMGGSFGGYMANWVAGSTDRFKAIVTHASLWELRGFHGTTDFGAWWEREFGDPYVDASRYEAASPHRLAANIRTPLLVIHGEKDHRVPISEALRLWTDMARHGVEGKFLYFPDENHWILKPQNARIWYDTVLAFLDQHVLGREWQRPQLL
jgi:dipeptidyl aminopeptidase/acylaminoacyl peptidase